MKSVNKGLLCAALGMVGASWLGSAQAVPAFAHKYEKNCSYCHTAWPQLNEKGRKFKEMGYRLKEDLKGEVKDTPYLDGFPMGAIIVSRPYDKKSNGEREMHGVHEAELFIAGSAGKNLSTFVELEAEDENDWNVEFGHAVLNYRHNDAVNVELSWSPMFFADPYGTISDHFSPTVSHYALVNGEGGTVNGPSAADFGGADGSAIDNVTFDETTGEFVSADVSSGAMGDSRHNVAVTGRINKFFYIAGISGVAGSTTGEKDAVLNGRLAYDITDNMMVGVLAVSGKTTVTADLQNDVVGEKDVKFTRVGVDFMGDFGNSRLQAGYISGKDDQLTYDEANNALIGDGSTTDKVLSIQGMHTFKTEKGKPTWVPVARYENYTKNDGDDKYADLVLGVSYFLKENVKAMLEYKSDMDAPDGVDKENRATLQINVGL
ncbi:MAG: hypothetical protein PVF82_03445 [Gammaproteobacteria bacterium]|jgi:hypothetical protein